jgi:hypothetical protein
MAQQRLSRGLRRIFGAAALTWLLSGAVDQALGIYDRLPERVRGWIEGAIIAKVVGVMAFVVFLVCGIVGGLKPIYVAALAVVMQMQRAIEWLKGGAFEVMPVSASGAQVGIGEELLAPEKVYARIGVGSKRDVGRCVAVVTAISVYQKNWMGGSMLPLLWNARYLCWTPDENRERRATILKGITMTADLAVTSKSDHGHFQITSADDGARHKFPPGFYKINLTVMSESGGGARRDVSMCLLYESSPSVGAPFQRLIVQPWRDEFVEHQRKEDEDARRRKKAAK